MYDVLLVKYGEIAIRGKNRYLEENRLVKIISKNLKSIGSYWVSREQGRFVVECKNKEDKFDFERVIPNVLCVLGVTAVCPGICIEDDSVENIEKCALEHFRTHFKNAKLSFKVVSKRSDKSYPLTSNEISARVGGFILKNTECTSVDVHNPDITVYIELRNNVYVYSKLIKGYGGLPIGSSGKATVLMSGGIDSPVAAFLTARRGVEISAVYFDSPPYTSDRAKQKVIDLAKRLSVFTGGIKLYCVPFTDVQLKIYESFPQEKITIFLKRAMLKASEKIAFAEKSLALVTGDSIGQVASQTMHAINAIDSAAKELPVLRPLCTMDKQDIIDIARKIETFDISVRPYEDCCTVFVAKHPETKPKKQIIESMERKIEGLDELIELAVKETEIIDI